MALATAEPRPFSRRIQRLTFLRSVLVVGIVFLALTRWMPGEDPLKPETGSRAWIEMALLILAFLMTLVFWGPKVIHKGFRSPSFIFLSMLSLWAIISAAWSQNPILTAGRGLELLLIGIITSTLADQTAKKKVSFPLILLVSLLLIIGFLMLVNVVTRQSILPMALYNGRLRLVLAMNHPNATATFFASLVLIATYLLLFKRKVNLVILSFFLVLVGLFLVVRTDSRTTLLATLLAIGLMILFRTGPKPFFFVVLVTISLVLITALFTLSTGAFDHQINSFFARHPDYLTINGRTQLWEEGFRHMQGINLVGSGYFNTRFLFIEQYEQAWGFHSHNSFLEIFFSLGFIGTILAFLYYFYSLITMKNIWRFPLPLVYLFYITLESMMEIRIFFPYLTMFILSALVFYQQSLYVEGKGQGEFQSP